MISVVCCFLSSFLCDVTNMAFPVNCSGIAVAVDFNWKKNYNYFLNVELCAQ